MKNQKQKTFFIFAFLLDLLLRPLFPRFRKDKGSAKMTVGSIQFITDEETRGYLGGKRFLIVGVGWGLGFVGELVWSVLIGFALSSTSTFRSTPLAHTFPLSAKLPETLRTQTKVDFFIDKEDREEKP